jgi:hypothetical protein
VPHPLPEEERKRFIQEALKAGAPPERIKADLGKLEGYGPGGTVMPQGAISQQAQGRLDALQQSSLEQYPVAAGYPYSPTGTEEPLFPLAARQTLLLAQR